MTADIFCSFNSLIIMRTRFRPARLIFIGQQDGQAGEDALKQPRLLWRSATLNLSHLDFLVCAEEAGPGSSPASNIVKIPVGI